MKNTITRTPFAIHPRTIPTVTSPAAMLDTLQSRFALRVTSGLSEHCEEINPDISERLRFARNRALERARLVRAVETSSPVGTTSHAALILGKIGTGWWLKLASVLPVVALAAGLVLIQRSQDVAQISVAAEIDAALLADALPPIAYSDPGFVEFLKTPRE